MAKHEDRSAVQRPITPRRSTTRHFYTLPGSWNEERIAEALREWTQEAGLPPKSYEWCPGSARPAGLIGPEESKWEREHPRWPGNTTVYRYFDSWAAALEAAGITPIWPSWPEGTLAERVEAARRMHEAGESNRSIADALGVKPDTVRRYLKAHPCRDCDNPVIGRGKLCHACATGKSNPRRWSKEEVIVAVRRWARLEGRAPTSAAWRPAHLGGSRPWECEGKLVAIGDPHQIGAIGPGAYGRLTRETEPISLTTIRRQHREVDRRLVALVYDGRGSALDLLRSQERMVVGEDLMNTLDAMLATGIATSPAGRTR